MFFKLMFQMALISKCLHHSENLSLSWFVVFLIYFSYLEGYFFSTCVHFLHTQKHTHKKEFGVTSGLISV